MGKARILSSLILVGVLPAGSVLLTESQATPQARCACCTVPGTWSQLTRVITPEEFAELGRLRFAAVANSQAAAQYKLVHDGRTRDWTLEFYGESGRGGALKFTVPDRATFFLTDVQDGLMTEGSGPVLYKELRMTGRTSGTGTFPGGDFQLVLQGRGGACPEAADYSSWILRVDAPGSPIVLFGKFEKPRSRLGSGEP